MNSTSPVLESLNPTNLIFPLFSGTWAGIDHFCNIVWLVSDESCRLEISKGFEWYCWEPTISGVGCAKFWLVRAWLVV